jgi:hypothetical protein
VRPLLPEKLTLEFLYVDLLNNLDELERIGKLYYNSRIRKLRHSIRLVFSES